MARHDKTLEEIFARPTRADVRWSGFASLVRHLGGTVEPAKGNGSRMQVKLRGIRATLHRPHPGDEMPKVLLEDIREFLERAGVSRPSPKHRKGTVNQGGIQEVQDGSDA